MTLPRRQLGSSDLSITTVGFGAWAAGGGDWSYGWGPQDDLDSIGAMRRALELGVNWIDSAAVYGLGHSEEVVGRFLAELPIASRPLIFTKGGLVWNDANRMEPPKQTLEPASVRRECEASLKRLGVERIDLYQYHWPDMTGVAIEDSWSEMNRLIDSGKVRYGGVSNFDVDLLDRCEKVRHVASLQPPFSMIRRDAASEVIPWCAKNRTGVIVYSPMQAGILTDSFSADRVARLTANDWRRGNPNFKSPAVEKNIALRDGLVPIAKRLGATVSAVAIAWVLGWTGVTGAIVGARTAEQVHGWIGGASLRLPAAELDQIAGLIGSTQAGKGPARPV